MENRLQCVARAALRPNAVIMGVACCQFGWAVAESLRPVDEFGDSGPRFEEELLFLASMMLVASVGLATGSPLGRLLAAALCGPLALLQVFIFTMLPYRFKLAFLSGEHVERWLRELADIPASVWLMTALSFAILCSATVATLRRTPSRP